MLRSKILVLISAVLVAGCPATSMLRDQHMDIQQPPKRQFYPTDESYVEAIREYQFYLENYRQGLGKGPSNSAPTACTGVFVSKEYVLPSAPQITTDEPKEQLEEILDYLDEIRSTVKTHNEVIKSQRDLYELLCPSVDKYIVP